MVFKGLIAAATAVAMTVTPTVAAASSSAAAAQAAVAAAPADETVDEGSQLRGGFIIPVAVIIAILLGLCAAKVICGKDDDDLPVSPS